MGWWQDLKVSLGFKPTPAAPTEPLAQDCHEACFQLPVHPSPSVNEAAKATDEAGVQFKQPDQPEPPLELTEPLPPEEPKVASEPTLFKEKAKRVSTPRSSAGTKRKNTAAATKRQTKKVTK